MADESESATQKWPNQKPIVDGVVPSSEISQEPLTWEDTEEDLAVEMES